MYFWILNLLIMAKICKRISLNYFRINILVILFISLSPRIYTQVSWNTIGPGGGGWISSMTVVEDVNNTVYIGCDVGGIYKSIDHGKTWHIKNKGLSIYFTHDIASDPTNSEVLYLATRGGVFKSIDGAENWVIKRNGFPVTSDYNFSASISDIEIDPNNTEIIYAGVGIPETGYNLQGFHWQSNLIKGTIYKSFDGANSWSKIYNTGIDTLAMIYSLAIDPNNSNIVYAATSKGMYKSIDAGTNWQTINSGLPHDLCMTVLINPSNSNVLYVTLWVEPSSPVWKGGVYKSIDAGNTWIEKNMGLPQVVGSVSGLTNNFPSLLIDKNNPETLYVGNIPWTPDPGVYKTSNGGDSWIWQTRSEAPNKNLDLGWIPDASIGAMKMAIDPSNSNRLYFGTSMHLFKTENAGNSWDYIYTDSINTGYWKGNNFETTVADVIVVDPTNSNNIYAGYWDIGFFKSIDGGNSFKRSVNGMFYENNTFDIVLDPDDASIIYASGGFWEQNEGELYKSIDYGEHWLNISNGLPDTEIWSFAIDKNSPKNARTIYVGSYNNGIYKSTDGGQSWTLKNNGLGVNLNIKKISIDPNNSAVLYAGFEAKQTEIGGVNQTQQGGLYKSVDAGENWIKIDNLLTQMIVRDIKIVPSNSQIIYTAVSGDYDHTLEEYFGGGVFKSTDAGNSWSIVSSDFGSSENLEVTSLAINPSDNNIVYASTSDAPYHDQSNGRGIFKTINAGSSWQLINDNSFVTYFDFITIDPSNSSILYAGSNGNGILKGIDSSIVNSVEIFPNDDNEIYAVPNPLTINTEIHFVLSMQEKVTLSIYNIKGILVENILEKTTFSRGKHIVNWKVNKSLAQGIYFYRLAYKDKLFTGKLILKSK